MPKSSTMIFAATLLCTIVVERSYCADLDYSDYHDGSIVCHDRRKLKLGFAVSNETKHLMEVQTYKGEENVRMYVRIAPQNDYDEAKSDYEEVKKKIDGNHPDTISFKPGHVLRRAIKIPAEGFGTLKKEGRDDVLCYYFVVQYSDDYSDYEGGIIECFDGYSIELAEEKGKQSDYNHTLKVKTFKGKKDVDMFVRIAPLSHFDDVVRAIADCEIEKADLKVETDSYSKSGSKRKRSSVTIADDGSGILKKNGKENVNCYYYVVEYQSGSKKR